jgi:hypothetical protein
MDSASLFGVAAAIIAALLLGWAVMSTAMLSRLRSRMESTASESERLLDNERAKAKSLADRLALLERAAREAVGRARVAETSRDEARARFHEAQRTYVARSHKAAIQIEELSGRVRQLLVWQQHVDADAALRKMQDEVIRLSHVASSDARIIIANAEHKASSLLESARADSAAMHERSAAMIRGAEAKAESIVTERVAEIDRELDQAKEIGRDSRAHAAKVIATAEAAARATAGEAWEVRSRIRELREAETAIRNTIDGYGTRYLIPTYSLMDDAAAELVGSDPATKFRNARERSREMVESSEAVELYGPAANQSGVAARFLLDAFNGKADSIVNAARREDFGTLRQRMLDAFGLVNMHADAMQGGRISRQYLDSRLEEVRWACVLQEYRLQAKEEQRQIRERMREEAAARRDQERLQHEAEDAAQRQREIEDRLDAQRHAFEAEKAMLSVEAQERYLSWKRRDRQPCASSPLPSRLARGTSTSSRMLAHLAKVCSRSA